MHRINSIATIALGSLLFTIALILADRTIAGAVQCSALGCLNA